MNLIIDIGNSFTKLFIFDKDKLIHNSKIDKLRNNDIENLFQKYAVIKNVIISSVQESILVDQYFSGFNINKILKLDKNTPLPIKNKYQSPETLGYDRIAAAVGAYNIFPMQNVLAIDAGTAITFEFINNKGEYIGGNISLGLSMRFKALNEFTNKLPLLSPLKKHNFIGENTNEAIIAGVQNGIIFEIDGYIDELKLKFDDLKVILTGGDTIFFERKLKNRIFAKPFLVALGLNRILQDNVNKI